LFVSEIRELKSVLVYPHLLNDENENKRLTSVVMKLVTELDGLGLVFDREISSNYDKESLTDSLFDAFALNADVVFVINPLKSFGENDVVSLAVKSAADDIFSYSIPQVGASDLLIAQKGTSKIIVLPCYYDQKDSNISNQIIKHAIYTEHLTAAEFNYKPSPNIEANFIDEDNLSKVISPSNRKTKAEKASIGAVILAAGQGRRSGTNKLLVEDQNNIPMFMHAINSAIASDAKPVFVVTGYRHEEMEEYLEKIDVNVLYNPSYASGIKTSINMGLRAIPSSCDGAILLPADMPYISAADINKLINKFDKNFEKQVCMYSNKGVKSNPILWSKSLYEKADIVPDNAMTRVVFVEHADYTKTIETKDKKKLLDINYPNDVEEFSKQ
jgi:molybdenum cofactor cytidylyltransferase